MKKIIALLLSVIMVFCLSVTAFAAESPTATGKIKVKIRKADYVDFTGKVDVEYTVDVDKTLTVKADDKQSEAFKNWSVYKVVSSVEGVSAPVNSGVIILNAALNLAATTKVVEAVQGTDYEIIKGGLDQKEMTIKLKNSVIVCANYGSVVTDPLVDSSADSSASAPKTRDMTIVYAAVVMLAFAAMAFGVKKVYSK